MSNRLARALSEAMQYRAAGVTEQTLRGTAGDPPHPDSVPRGRGHIVLPAFSAVIVAGAAIAVVVASHAGSTSTHRHDAVAPTTESSRLGAQAGSPTASVAGSVAESLAASPSAIQFPDTPAGQLVERTVGLLPAGVSASGFTYSPKAAPNGSFRYDDGNGTALVSVGSKGTAHKPGAALTCEAADNDNNPDSSESHCTELTDGSTLTTYNVLLPDARAGIVEWTASLTNPSGVRYELSEVNSTAESGVDPTRATPPLTTAQLGSIVQQLSAAQ
jgi:hypothetical protein